jgi:hypothetical protein
MKGSGEKMAVAIAGFLSAWFSRAPLLVNESSLNLRNSFMIETKKKKNGGRLFGNIKVKRKSKNNCFQLKTVKNQ